MTKVLKQAAPNGWLVRLIDDGEWGYLVEEPDGDESMETEFELLDDAQFYYESAIRRWHETPNWEAQARYDEAHGTDNGYGLWQSAREY